MSRWIEVSLRVDGESAEAIAEVLGRYGHQGVSLEQADIAPDTWDETDLPPAQNLTLRAYFPDDARADATKMQLEAALGHMRRLYPMPDPAYRLLREEDWAQAWKAHYQPLRIGRRLLIHPRWIDVTLADGDIVIALDPGMAFGTGTHPTTQLCLQALERVIQPGQVALDLGCGSGILSIAAVKLGARQVLALDIDAIAVAATRDNAAYNGVAKRISAEQGSLDSLRSAARRFDLLIVNILARVIIQLAAQGLGEILRPGGTALFSGIIDEQADEVATALDRAGLQIVARHQQGDWLLYEARRLAD
ncbi:MAG: 50S ribosomal protein L11 methyltransferase [Chloroflexi bacterium]|nr:50S ribosomal protein L11 methyltransferase [Chloroflexota bacterium]